MLSNGGTASGSAIPGDLPASTTSIDYARQGITGTIPTELGNLVYATQCQLNGNPLLSSTIPTELAKLTKLTAIDLGEAALTGTVPTEFGLLHKKLTTHFNLNSNPLHGRIPTQLGQLKKLANTVWLFDDGFTGPIPSELGKLTKMVFNLR